MIGKEVFDTVNTLVAQHEPPVLSLYLNTNLSEQTPKQTLLQARAALEEAKVPGQVVKTTLGRLESDRLVLSGRSLALFSCQDFFNAYPLQIELPLPDSEVLAQWGDPLVSPFLLAMSEHRHYGVVLVNEENWLFYEVFMGEIELKARGQLELNDENWRHLNESKPAAAKGLAKRGGAGRDTYEKRKDDWKARFFKEATTQIEQHLRQNTIDRLLMIGQKSTQKRFEDEFSIQTKTLLTEPIYQTPKFDIAEGELLRLLEPQLDKLEQKRMLELLDKAREGRIWGVNATLEALQTGRLDTILAPWHQQFELEFDVRQNQYVPALVFAMDYHSPHQVLERSSFQLFKALPALAIQQGSKVMFLRGEAEKILLSEFQGLAGLARW